MTYPVTNNAQIAPDGQLELTFRPSVAGLVNVVVVGLGIPPPPPQGDANAGQATPYTIHLRLEVFKPGASTPAASTDAKRFVHPGDSNRVVAWLNTQADAADLGGDWLARVTNFGDGAATCRCSARYQVVPGNLGKVDHVVVLMLENRSFDHMLGYLKLQGKRPDLEGLSGAEVNRDANNVAVSVHPLATDGRTRATYFANDPGHGWPDVQEQLGADSVTGLPNGGFVKNFTRQLAQRAQNLPPEWTTVHDVTQLDSEDSTIVAFRPVLPGKVLVHTVLDRRGTQSEMGILAQLTLRRPGQTTPVATVKLPFSPDSPLSAGLSHDVTAAELAAAGNWTLTVTNGVMQPVTFTTDVSFMVALHDTRGQEPPAAIMGYYDATQLPAFDLLAAEYGVCDHWFASLPTDTWPNRLFALTGGSPGLDTTPSGSSVPSQPPGYTFTSIFEVLQQRQIDWEIFFSDFPFPLVFKELAQHAEYTARMRPMSSFLLAAQTGDLPAVAWLEPAFLDVEQAIARDDFANDDHPPGDVARGQQLVQQVYSALADGPGWAKTLLIITYDEHGGFFDHVTPPSHPAPPDDGETSHGVYGVRVPALVVSPWVAQAAVSRDVFDHTSLLGTILRRFCAGAVPSMGGRADRALDVGPLLSEASARAAVNMAPPPAPDASEQAQTVSDGFGAMLRKMLLGF